MKIRKHLLSKDKYSLKSPYEMTPKYIVIHNTYNNASAENEINYMVSNNNVVSFHYAVDDKEAIQGVSLNRNTWNAGDGKYGPGNRQGISIEICYSKNGGPRFTKAQKNAAELTALLMKQFNIPISHVLPHKHFNGKNCPHRTLENGWDKYLDEVASHLQEEPIVEKDEYFFIQLGAFKTMKDAEKYAKKYADKLGQDVGIKFGSKYNLKWQKGIKH